MSEKEIQTMKFSFEEKFNKLFYSKDFKEKMVAEYHYCPQGLTFESYYDEDSGIWSFCACCKKYNYDYSGDELGDYIVLKTKTTGDWALFMYEYIKEHDKELYDTMNGEIYFYK